jgi:creatinine amidohydrolase
MYKSQKRLMMMALVPALAAGSLMAQNATAQVKLAEYDNPPSVKRVDTVFMEDMTWLEIKNELEAGKTTVLVPAGGLEASGPFLTLNKHQNMLRGTTDLIARKLGNALIAPFIKYTPADEPIGVRGNYLGDFSISVATYKATLMDICASLRDHGFTDIMLIGDHQGAQRGMKEVADELDSKWMGGPAQVTYVPEYYDRTAVRAHITNALGITEVRAGLGDNYFNTSILLAVEPSGARLNERTEGGQLTVNGVNLEPVGQTVENGKQIMEMQTDLTVKAIQEAISGGNNR